MICNGTRAEWSPIRSVIIRVINKTDLFITSMITDNWKTQRHTTN